MTQIPTPWNVDFKNLVPFIPAKGFTPPAPPPIYTATEDAIGIYPKLVSSTVVALILHYRESFTHEWENA